MKISLIRILSPASMFESDSFPCAREFDIFGFFFSQPNVLSSKRSVKSGFLFFFLNKKKTRQT